MVRPRSGKRPLVRPHHICVEADASKREALLAFLEVERPNENFSFLKRKKRKKNQKKKSSLFRSLEARLAQKPNPTSENWFSKENNNSTLSNFSDYEQKPM